MKVSGNEILFGGLSPSRGPDAPEAHLQYYHRKVLGEVGPEVGIDARCRTILCCRL